MDLVVKWKTFEELFKRKTTPWQPTCKKFPYKEIFTLSLNSQDLCSPRLLCNLNKQPIRLLL